MADDTILDYSCKIYSNMYFNVTCEFDPDYAVVMYGYIAPFLLVVTAVSNALIVAVLSRPHMRTPTNIILTALAFCDIFTVLIQAPWNFYLFTLGNHYKPLGPAVICQAWRYMTEVIPTIFHAASIWLTVALAVQQYIYVCHPSVARNWCTTRRVVQCLIGIGVTSFLMHLSRLLDLQAVPYKIMWRGKLEEVCQWRFSSWVKTLLTEEKYSIFYTLFNVPFAQVIPCISITTFKVLLIRAMRTAQLNRKKLFNENQKSEAKRLRESNRTTLILIFALSVILLVELPIGAYYVVHLISVTTNIQLIPNFDSSNYWFIHIATFVGDFSYPINFAIYCGMSQQFRETFKSLFIRNKNIVTSSSHTSELRSCRWSNCHSALSSASRL